MTVAACYYRISSDPRGLAEGVDRQRQDCRARAAREGWEIVEYEDSDISASNLSSKPRPSWDRMLADVRDGKADVILAYSNSRLTRRDREFLDLIDLSRETGVKIRTIVSGDDDLSTADGRMVAKFKGAADVAEAERISERCRAAHKSRAGKGQMKVGRRPFGYDPTGMELVPEEAALVREGIRRLIDGDSLRSILRHFIASGVPTSMGKAWSVQSIKVVLSRWRNAGVVVYQGQPVGEGDFPAIVSKEDQTLAIKMLSDPSRKAFSYDTQPKHLLSHVMVCGKCRATMRATSSDQYQCTGDYCVSIQRARADAYVLGRLAEYIAEDGIQTSGAATRMREVTEEIQRLTDDEQALAASKVSLAFKLAAAEDLAAQKAPLESELVRLRQAHALEAVAVRLTPSPTTFGQTMGHVQDNASTVLQGLMDLTIEDRRRVLAGKLTVTLMPVGRGNKPGPEERISIQAFKSR